MHAQTQCKDIINYPLTLTLALPLPPPPLSMPFSISLSVAYRSVPLSSFLRYAIFYITLFLHTSRRDANKQQQNVTTAKLPAFFYMPLPPPGPRPQ